MYVVKVLGKVHEHEHLEDMIIDLMAEAEMAYANWDGSDTTESRRRRIEYERAILECFRIATMK